VPSRNAQVHQQKLGTLQGLKIKNTSEKMDTNGDSAEGNHVKVYALYFLQPSLTMIRIYIENL